MLALRSMLLLDSSIFAGLAGSARSVRPRDPAIPRSFIKDRLHHVQLEWIPRGLRPPIIIIILLFK
jgi:hypothetical protein